jgi:hypothetical protein
MNSGTADSGRTAYLVDEYWPEFDQYLQQRSRPSDLLVIPLDGDRWRKPNYAWTLMGYDQVHAATLTTLQRAIACRRLPAQGQSRQSVLLHHDAKLAQSYGSRLSPDITHVVLVQNLLPFLWREGHLGGRTFEVLMTRLPLGLLQQRLDAAHRQHPQSETLADFRVDQTLVEQEKQALQAAQKIITPHTEIARLFPAKTIRLDWHLPQISNPTKLGNAVLFPASALGRKGAYEVRQAEIALNLPLKVLGRDLEAKNFWQGVNVQRSLGHPLDGVGLVVLPAYVEHCPRLLLEAIASHIPVIASTACGIDGLPGVKLVAPGESAALIQAMQTRTQALASH